MPWGIRPLVIVLNETLYIDYNMVLLLDIFLVLILGHGLGGSVHYLDRLTFLTLP